MAKQLFADATMHFEEATDAFEVENLLVYLQLHLFTRHLVSVTGQIHHYPFLSKLLKMFICTHSGRLNTATL